MTAVVTALAAAILFAPAWTLAAPRQLSDAELDAVHGGNTTALDPTEDAHVGNSDGAEFSTDIRLSQSIYVGAQAQQNLTSLVNILAVDSAIQVQLNLNVSVNSSVGSVTQGNSGTQSGQP